ncbi:MAG: TolC family protein [Myxococcota bacterium]
MNPRTRTFLSGLATLACLSAAPAWAETLTLPVAVARAQERNHDLAIARSRLEEARATQGRVTTAFLPNIQAVGTYTHNSKESKLDSGAMILGIAKALNIPFSPANLPPPSIIQKADSFGAAVTLDETVFSLTPVLMRQSASRAVEAQEAGLEATRREIAYQVAQIFYNTAGVERLVQVAERALALSDKRIAVAEQRRAAGAEGEVTVLRAQSERDKAEQDLVRAQLARQQLLVALGNLIGDATPTDLAPPPDIAAPEGDLAALMAQVVRNRSDLQAKRKAVEAAQSSLREAELRWLPMVTVGANGRYTDTTGFAGENWLWSASANLIVPIFDRGARYADARERRQTVVRLQQEVDKAEADLRAAVQQSQQEIEASRHTLVVATRQAEKAKRTAEIIASAQQAGAATSLEVAEADTSLRLAESGVEREHINLDLAYLRLRHLTGQVRPDQLP